MVYGGGNIYFEGNEVLHSNPLYPWMQALIEGSRESGQEQSVVAMRNGFMLKNSIHTLAGNDTLSGGTVSIINMSVKNENGPIKTLDTLYRNMMRISAPFIITRATRIRWMSSFPPSPP